jgi:hypothetical protein
MIFIAGLLACSVGTAEDPTLDGAKSKSQAFSAAKIRKLRETAVAAVQVPQETAEGWSKSSIDPAKLLTPFAPLHLRKGYSLRAYQFKEDGNGNAVVWAMPANADFPDPKDCPTLENHLLKAPKPAEALDDAMEAVEGDGTPWSCLAASLLRRELSDFGAMWHGSNWGMHFVLDEDPWMADAPDSNTPPLESPNGPASEWKWLEDAPKDWRPRVDVYADRVTVTFYTYCGLERQRLYRHVDTYRSGKLRAKTVEKVIAEGPDGVMR